MGTKGKIAREILMTMRCHKPGRGPPRPTPSPAPKTVSGGKRGRHRQLKPPMPTNSLKDFSAHEGSSTGDGWDDEDGDRRAAKVPGVFKAGKPTFPIQVHQKDAKRAAVGGKLQTFVV